MDSVSGTGDTVKPLAVRFLSENFYIEWRTGEKIKYHTKQMVGKKVGKKSKKLMDEINPSFRI